MQMTTKFFPLLIFIGLGMCVYVSTSCSKEKFTPVTEPTVKDEMAVDSSETKDTVTVLDPSTIDTSRIYIPNELKNLDLYKSSSPWYYGRSKQSEHFIVFWGAGYGDRDPNSSEVPAALRVDIDDLLLKAEEFYALNVDTLAFAKTGEGQSNLDKYKMMIFILYQEEWLATGAGYDDVVGALWVSPSTCHPVGSVIAHEIGHSFQYQVFCDLGNGTGFRYGFGGNGGNAFWEQTAQWQAYQSYPEQIFNGQHTGVYLNNNHRHICHENYRYASYLIHYYWAEKHGRDIIGRLWREAQQPEDPLQAYSRITGISTSELNDEIYDYATKMVTWDIDAIRSYGAAYNAAHSFEYTTTETGAYQVAYSKCPGTTGYNVIRLKVPEADTEVSVKFTGVVNAPGFNQVEDVRREGWRYGFVALLENGTRVYGDMNRGTTKTLSFTVPENCEKLWFVVTGAPNSYAAHPWDDDESNDDQWPYQIKITNSDIFGNVTIDPSGSVQDVTLTYDVSFPVSATAYDGTTLAIGEDLDQLAQAFLLQPPEITSKLDQDISFFAVEKDGSLNPERTANGYGHWFDADGDVIAWGDSAQVYSEFDANAFSFTLGQYPGHCAAGDQYTIRQALVYEYEPEKTVQAIFVFNIKLE